jgi:hypothetical protein
MIKVVNPPNLSEGLKPFPGIFLRENVSNIVLTIITDWR